MAETTLLRQILNEADGKEPIAKVNGKPVYSFEDANALNIADLAEQKLVGKRVETGERTIAPDGGYTSSMAKRVAMDPTTYFENRYRKVSDTKFEVVTDYRAIKEQGSGNVYTNNVIAYEIKKVGKDGALDATGIKKISAEEFINDFKRKLNQESIMKALEAIGKLGNQNIQEDSI